MTSTPRSSKNASAPPKRSARRALPRVVFVVGPTSSGKTALGIAIAKALDGEVINADARQVYQGCAIGTGVPEGGVRTTYQGHPCYLVDGVPHYLMDFLPPTEAYTVTEWRTKALKAIRAIARRGKLPIVVGGTGMYIQALVDNFWIPPVAPEPAFREAMGQKPLSELVALLQKLDPEAARTVDLKNPRRVIRALEVVTYSGKSFAKQRRRRAPVVHAYQIGIAREKEELHARIDQAVEQMIERGWLDEIRALREEGVEWDAPAMTSIGYRELGAYLRRETTLESAIAAVKKATKEYTKRQRTWFKRDGRIQWVTSVEEGVTQVRAWLAQKTATR